MLMKFGAAKPGTDVESELLLPPFLNWFWKPTLEADARLWKLLGAPGKSGELDPPPAGPWMVKPMLFGALLRRLSVICGEMSRQTYPKPPRTTVLESEPKGNQEKPTRGS